MSDLTKDTNIVGDIRESVASRCAKYLERGWHDLESEEVYPTAVADSSAELRRDRANDWDRSYTTQDACDCRQR